MKKRELQPSVTIFLHHQDKYLFIKKNENRWVDSGRLNGVGGKVKRDESFLAAAIRETEEEVGLQFKPDKVKFCGFLSTSEGYPQDWLVGFYLIEVDSFKLPVGDKCDEGVFLWLTAKELFKQEAVLVDDLHYLFPDYLHIESPFFAYARLNDQEKVEEIEIKICG